MTLAKFMFGMSFTFVKVFCDEAVVDPRGDVNLIQTQSTVTDEDAALLETTMMPAPLNPLEFETRDRKIQERIKMQESTYEPGSEDAALLETGQEENAESLLETEQEEEEEQKALLETENSANRRPKRVEQLRKRVHSKESEEHLGQQSTSLEMCKCNGHGCVWSSATQACQCRPGLNCPACPALQCWNCGSRSCKPDEGKKHCSC